MSKPRFKSAKFSGAKKEKAPKVAVVLPQSPEQLESVLAALLAPDTAAIAEATKVMDAFMKVGAVIPALMQQIAQSANPHSRQMAAVLLRRCIVKLWKNVGKPEQAQVVRAHRAHKETLQMAGEWRRRRETNRHVSNRSVRTDARLSPCCLVSIRNPSSSLASSRSPPALSVTASAC